MITRTEGVSAMNGGKGLRARQYLITVKGQCHEMNGSDEAMAYIGFNRGYRQPSHIQRCPMFNDTCAQRSF
jgi:hypothetical protein